MNNCVVRKKPRPEKNGAGDEIRSHHNSIQNQSIAVLDWELHQFLHLIDIPWKV